LVKLSVNVNKVATLRNSRGGTLPSVVEAVRVCVDAGAPGITVHPRADERHIRRQDVFEVAAFLGKCPGIEFNIEGDPRPDLLGMVRQVRPAQCTLVPVMPGEITSQAGWPIGTPAAELGPVVKDLQRHGVRVSLFIDPDEAAVRWAHSLGADRIELYTEPFAQAFAVDRAAGLGINAGHDLDLANLVLFRTLPHLDEVSIGHALIGHALYVGLDRAVRDYLSAIAAA